MIRSTMQRVPLSINPLVERAGKLFPQVERPRLSTVKGPATRTFFLSS